MDFMQIKWAYLKGVFHSNSVFENKIAVILKNNFAHFKVAKSQIENIFGDKIGNLKNFSNYGTQIEWVELISIIFWGALSVSFLSVESLEYFDNR